MTPKYCLIIAILSCSAIDVAQQANDGKASDEAAEKAVTSATVTGRVFLDDTKAPCRKATVQLQPAALPQNDAPPNRRGGRDQGRPVMTEIGGLGCRSPLRQPELTLVSSAWSSTPCSNKSPDPENSMQTAAWIGSLEIEQAEIGLVPVSLSPVNFTNQFMTEVDRPGRSRHFCPGTPVTFTRYTLGGRSRSTFWINGFQLPRLDAGQITVMDQD